MKAVFGLVFLLSLCLLYQSTTASISISSLSYSVEHLMQEFNRESGAMQTRSTAEVNFRNTYRGTSICKPHDSLSVDQIARYFPQFYTELGTWNGTISCFAPVEPEGPLIPVLTDANLQLRTTVSQGNLYSCSLMAGAASPCIVFYPRFDGTGQYCTVDPTDFTNPGYPLERIGQLINDRLVVDSAWSETSNLNTAGLSYYEPPGNAISGYFGSWGEGALSTDRPYTLQCFFRVLRTCRGPRCFKATQQD
nr:hypothetical protein pmam_212 [Pithovirus mammoth]